MTEKSNPYADLVASIKRAMEYPMPLKLRPVNKEGDVCFTVPLSSFSWSNLSLNSPVFHSTAFANIIGTILVRSHLNSFGNVIASKFYPEACNKFKHTGFGLKIVGQDVEFQMHCSLLLQIFNIYLWKELQEVRKEIINIPVEKKNQSDNALTITAYADDKSYKVIVSKQGNLEHSISTALSTILEHYGIKKDVHATMGMFNLEIETAEKSKTENY